MDQFRTPQPTIAPRGAASLKRTLSRQILFFALLMILIFGSMILLPLAILYFIDPSIADVFITYSVPYILVAFVIVMVIFGIVAAAGALMGRRRPQAEQFNIQYQPHIDIDRAQLDHVVVKKVKCEYCGTMNPETESKCMSCGANL